MLSLWISMLHLTSVHSNLKPLFVFVGNSEVIYVAECMYGMVFFSFQGKSNAEERKWNKKILGEKISGSCVQVQISFFFTKYFIEVEGLRAIKRIVLIMAFIIHSSIYWAPTYGAQHLLLQATLIFQEWCLTLFLLMWSSNQCV